MISILNITFSVSYDNGKLCEAGPPSNLGLISNYVYIDLIQ